MTAPRYPHAQWRPLGAQAQSRMTSHAVICLHTMVGSLWGTDAYFRSAGYSGTESHFGVGHDGTTLQWQDLDYTADANLEGKYRVISIETSDYGESFGTWNTGDASQVPAWTTAQVNRLADLVAWLCRTYAIPCALIPNSVPGHRGVGYHRQGVDPYRASGGERWSTSYGKVCPGARRIAQIPTVIARAAAILAGGTPAPSPEDDMPFTTAQLEKIVADNCSRAIQAWVAGGINQQFDSKEIANIRALDPANGVLGELVADVREIKATLAALATQDPPPA